jgi:type VI protein secretion system component Hcp
MPVYLLIAPADAVTSNYDVDMAKALKGDVVAPGHEQWIDVTSYSIKGKGGPPSNDVSPESGEGDVTLTRDSIDGISPLLLRWSGSGRAPVKKPIVAIIDVVKEGQVYQELKLSDVEVSAYQTKGNGGTKRSESFTLSYGKLESFYYRGDSSSNAVYDVEN